MQSCLSDDLNPFASPSFPDADLPEELKALLKSIGDSATALFSTTQFTPHVPGEPPGEPPEPPPHKFFTPPDVGWPVSPSSPYSPFSTPSSKTSFSSPNTVYSSGEFTSASPPPQFLSAPSLPPANVYPTSFTQPNMIFATVPWMFSFHALQAAGGGQGSYSGVIESDAVAMIHKTSVERPLPKQWTCPKCNRELSKHNKSAHLKTHLPPELQQRFKCTYPDCDKLYSRSNELKKHFMAKHYDPGGHVAK